MEMILVRLAIAAVGAGSLYLGYKLFCDVPQRRFSNLAAGALLAIFGLGILFAEARGIAATTRHPQHGWSGTRPTEQGSYDEPRLHRVRLIERTA